MDKFFCTAALAILIISADNMSMHTDYDNRVGFLVHDVGRLIRYRFDARARSLGVTRPQWRVLLVLARDPGLNQAELADRIDVERITACRMVDRLVEANLVERRADPSDRRVWRLHLQPAAYEIVDEVTAIGKEIEEETMAPLAPEDRVHLIASLQRIRDGLRDDGRGKDDRRRNVA